jgi:hypothetical protein
LSEDFDKSDSPIGIDFHEAERLFIERFEETYPAFIAYFNTRITGSGLSTNLWIQWRHDSPGNISGFSGTTPAPTEVVTYANKIGYNASKLHQQNSVNIDWSRRDAGKWGS